MTVRSHLFPLQFTSNLTIIVLDLIEIVNLWSICILNIDIDECTAGQDKCDSFSTYCVNVPGSYKCECRNGFEQDTPFKCKGSFILLSVQKINLANRLQAVTPFNVR